MEIIVAIKLYFKNPIFSIKAGIRRLGGGVIALFTSAIMKKTRALAMQTSEK